MNAPDLQIWNNFAFDDDDTEESAAIKASSWSPQKPILLNLSEALNLDFCKENKSPVPLIPIKPINFRGKPLKLLFKQGILSPSLTNSQNGNEPARDDKIDTEMEEIEMEINRLSSKLEALRLEKAERNLKTTEKADQNLKITEKAEKTKKQIGGNLVSNPTAKIQRRGVSLGPAEIFGSVRSRPPIKPEITPIKSVTQSRRKSCFYKLKEINEEKVTKERKGGRNLSLSPISRRSISKNPNSKQGFTTTGSKKSVKKDEGVILSIQPKELFKEGERSVGAKKPIKNGRVVASRYNQIPAGIRKQSEQWKDDSRRSDKKVASLVGKSPRLVLESGRNNVPESQTIKRWEIPSNVLVDSPSTAVMKMVDLLPKIKTIRRTEDHISPRDSGAAKKVAELISKKSYFGAESIELENSVCHVLDFEEEEE